MPLRLNGSTSGYSQLDAPAIAGDQLFTLPGAGGTLAATNSSGIFSRLPNLYVAAVRSTSGQAIGTSSTFVFNSELQDPYSLYDGTTGIFTVTADHVGTYLVMAGLNVYSMQSPSGESTFSAGIYKNTSTALQYQEIWETTNPDETQSGMSIVAVAQLNTAGDNIRVSGILSSTSSAKELSINSSFIVLRLF